MKPSAERFPRKGRKPLKRNIPDFPADAVKLRESRALIRIGINLETFVRLQRQAQLHLSGMGARHLQITPADFLRKADFEQAE